MDMVARMVVFWDVTQRSCGGNVAQVTYQKAAAR